ncbi:MAG: holo-ACP synthase [Clostridiales bacterium]|nr:holo-ACP synthase [Clostridiales bacterium]
MIIGIGVDLIEIDRIKKACEKEAFLLRYYTEEELSSLEGNTIALVDNFAVKEAVSKVFGTGFSGFMPIDIEVLRDAKGKPYVQLYGGAQILANKLKIKKIHVSISNTKTHTTAIAIGEGNSCNT